MRTIISSQQPASSRRRSFRFAWNADGAYTVAIGCLLICFFLLQVQPLSAGEFDFLHEYPGGFSAPVTASNVPQKKLSKTHADAFKRNLERLRDLLAAQPVFKPPLGVEIIGYFQPNDQFPVGQNLPVPGFGYLRFHFYHRDRKSGKPVRICCTTDEIFVSVNDPDQGFDVHGGAGFPSKVFNEPGQVGEKDGFPLYRMANGDEVIVMTRSTTPAWIPVTREEYITVWLKYWQKMAEQTSLDTLSPEAVRRHKAALESMSPEERKMQARHLAWDPFEPTLAPVGSNDGQPLVRTNPDWFNPSLRRTALQLITIRFTYTGNLNHNNPGATEYGDISPFRVWQALHISDWAEISKALNDK